MAQGFGKEVDRLVATLENKAVFRYGYLAAYLATLCRNFPDVAAAVNERADMREEDIA